MRNCGILLPVSSLPSEYGIGCFSKEAYEFVDRLNEAGQTYWQILPLGPTSYGDSPYQSFSTFAGNPYFIDLEELVTLSLLKKDDLKKASLVKNPRKVDYEKIYNERFDILRLAFKNFLDSNINKSEYESFKDNNKDWLETYAMFMAIKDSKGGISWEEWELDLRLRKEKSLKEYEASLSSEIEFYKFLQWMFERQWKKLKKYANSKGIKIIGDLPIYVAFDSSDAWANPSLFQFKDCKPIAVAGCPPDAFSKTGQLWGNPLYNWEYHKKTGYSWWIDRIKRATELYDTVRIDHFRGFDTYYSIPYGEKTAVRGRWRKGPGLSLFKKIKQELGDVDIIAEDLGYLTESVIKLLKGTGYPGMKVLHFAFYGGTDATYLPHNHVPNSIVYTGTHDNETTKGWLENLGTKPRKLLLEYIGRDFNKDNMVWEIIRLAYMSVSKTAIIPMQDFLELGNEARINTPSTLGGNWEWRMTKKDFSKKLAKKIRKFAELYDRVHIDNGENK